MRKVSRAQEQLSLFNFKTATKVHDWNPARADIADHTIETTCSECGEKMDHPNHASMGTPEPFITARNSNKTAVNLNVVHDVATMAPHVWNALKDVGHSVANEFDRARHDVAGVGHSVANEFDRARHDVAVPFDHARHDVAGVGHSVANEFDRARHDVAGVGHGIADVARGIGHGVADVAKGIGHGISSLFDMGRHDVAGVGHSVANEFDRARHDVAGVGHSVANEFDRARHDVAVPGHGFAKGYDTVRHDVSSIGHNDLDLAKTVGDVFVPDPTNSPDNISHVLYNYLSSPSVGVHGMPNHEIYNIVQHWRSNGGQMGGNALHNYPGLDKASGEILSQDLKNKFDAMENQAGNQFMADVGSAALTGLVPAAIGLGIKQHRDKKLENRFSSFDDRYAFEKTAKGEGEKGFKPPAGVQSAARHALKLIEEGKAGDGFTSVGRGRAHQLANGETLSLSTVKRMHSYFSRHRVDKKGKDWDNNSPGKVAWLAWGGDAGASWAAGIVKKHSVKTSMNWNQRYLSDGDYAHARRLGASHEEELDAHARGVDLIHYEWARDAGASHEQALDAHARGLDLIDYTLSRDAGASHEETLAAHARRREKAKEASAWPSSEHYEEHLEDLEELLHDTQKGVKWHEGQGEPAEKAKHQQLAEDLVKSIADARKLEK